MVYLYITMPAPRAEYPRPHDDIHGPFATEQEAWGFFKKLKIWYPAGMKQATGQVVTQAPAAYHAAGRGKNFA